MQESSHEVLLHTLRREVSFLSFLCQEGTPNWDAVRGATREMLIEMDAAMPDEDLEDRQPPEQRVRRIVRGIPISSLLQQVDENVINLLTRASKLLGQVQPHLQGEDATMCQRVLDQLGQLHEWNSALKIVFLIGEAQQELKGDLLPQEKATVKERIGNLAPSFLSAVEEVISTLHYEDVGPIHFPVLKHVSSQVTSMTWDPIIPAKVAERAGELEVELKKF